MKTNSKIWIGAAIGVAAVLLLKRTLGVKGIGAIKRAPRRIWQEVEAAQKDGIDLTDPNGWDGHSGKLDNLMQRFNVDLRPGTKPIVQRYFGQLRRAYKSIAGTDLPYKQSVVRNEYGDVILVYNDYEMDKLPQKAADYIRSQYTLLYGGADEAYWLTIADIATGRVKFVWSSKGVHRGVEKLIFGQSAPSERKQRVSYLASPEKGGVYPEIYAHKLWESEFQGVSDDQEITNGVLEAIRTCTSVGQARQMCIDTYLQAHHVEEPLLYQDVPF